MGFGRSAGGGNIISDIVSTSGGSSGMSNPMTTSGDIIYGAGGGSPQRLAKGSDGQVLSLSSGIPAWATISGSGTVTTINTDSTTDGIFNNTSHVIGTTSVTLTLTSQTKNTVLCGPASGSNAAPAFRALVGADLPLPQSAVLGGVFSKAAVSHQFLTAIVAADGSVTSAQPAFTDISGTASAAQLPNPSSSTLGGIQSYAAVTHQWINTISISGVPASAQPAFTDISGSVAAGQMPALTGDITTSAGAVTTTLATVNSNVGSFGSTTAIPVVTVNGKGLVTAVSTAAVVAPAGTVTGTTLASNVVTSSLTTVGTIGTGVWQGSAVAVSYGGTGAATFTANQLLLGNGTSAISALAAGSQYQVLTMGAANPGYGAVNLGQSAAITGTLPVGNGGTGQSSNWNADGVVYASSTTVLASTTAGTSGQVLMSNGGGQAPTMQTLAGNTSALAVPTVQRFTSTGTQTGWLFTISTTTTCAVGDTYTNNATTYTVQGALTATNGQVLFCSGVGSPNSGAALVRTSGSGTSSISFSANVATATYTTPANVLYLKVLGYAAGGGGVGSGSVAGGTPPTAGGNTWFGANLMVLDGGGIGTWSAGAGGAGGVAISLGSGGSTIWSENGQGGGGSSGPADVSGSRVAPGGMGGGHGGGSGSVTTGTAAGANTGGGGGGGGGTATASLFSGPGGGGGARQYILITSPLASYPYIVGAKGTGGSAGTSGSAGGNGADGLIAVEEYRQ